jgi:hypothetical protein
VQKIWTGTRWFIEGDIAQYFDSIDHQILLQLLAKCIHDNRFLELVRRLLKAGYLEDWTYHPTLSGTPQGGVLSPLLANVYLHEFDQYVTGTLIPANTRGTQRRTDSVYQQLCNRRCYNKRKRGIGPEAKALQKAIRSMPSKDQYDAQYRRLWYVRYADDVLLGYIGTRQEAEEIKAQIKAWLHDTLHLTLSDDKTLITHATDTPARFLGYEIVNQQCNTKCTKGKRSVNGRIGLRVPHDVIAKKCEPYLRKGKPIHRPERLANSDYSIVADYQQEYRGIVQYYLLATNVSALGKLRWVMETSLLKTLAAKHHIRMKAALQKYLSTTVGADNQPRRCLAVRIEREGRPALVAQFGGIPLQRQPTASIEDRPPRRAPDYTELEQRVRANECEVCGSKYQVEVHHVRKLADLKRKDGRTVAAWKQQMMARQRKTLVLCRDCHVKLHSGHFDANFELRR